MIGYMKPQKHAFDTESRELYQALYCGLCRNLNYEYGIKGTLLVNYEIVDMLLVIEALIDDEPSIAKQSCSITPFLWKKMAGYDDMLFKLGAAISIIIAALELRDNIVDDDKIRDKAFLALLSSAITKVKSNYPREWEAIENVYNEYMLIENKAKQEKSGFYAVLSACGTITREIGKLLGNCVSSEHANSIGVLMYYWGEWIYLLDAVDDYEKDCKSGKYNPLLLSDCPSYVVDMLWDLETNAYDVIDSLFIKRYKSTIEDLFKHHLPERRQIICNKSNYNYEE